MSAELRTAARSEPSAFHLLCRAADRWCAIPLESVVETFRPFEVRSIAGAPEFLRGVAVLRGEPVPVVDAGVLLGRARTRAERLVAVRAGARRVALAVDAVAGTRELTASAAARSAPLLALAEPRVIDAVGVVDAQLLCVLSTARLISEELWVSLEEGTRGA